MDTALLGDEWMLFAYRNRSGIFAYIRGQPDKSCNSRLKARTYGTGAAFLLFTQYQSISNTLGVCLLLIFTVVTLK